MNLVQSVHFSSDSLLPEEGQRAFQAIVAPLYDITPIGDPLEFRAVATSHLVDDLFFTGISFSPNRFRREERHIGTSAAAPLVLELQLAGEQLVTTPKAHFRMLPGHIYLRDWSCTFESFTTAMEMISVAIPRDRLAVGAEMGVDRPLLSWSTEAPEGRMLARVWSQLVSEFDRASPESMRILAQGFLWYIDALTQGPCKSATKVTLGDIQQYLTVRLHDDVDLGELCTHFKVSRSTVFRLFQPLGGVQNYVTLLRLDRCYSELLEAHPDSARVSDIARTWGFRDPTTFSRSFRRRFGVSPSQVLEQPSSVQQRSERETSRENDGMRQQYRKWVEAAAEGRPPSMTDENAPPRRADGVA